jgi:LEA14-like dessication related protein
MKNYFFLFWLFLLSIGFFSCAEIKPVTIGGVENPVVKTLSTAGADFTFGMKILNPNSMGVTVYPSSFDANVGGIDIGKIKLAKRVRIKANSNGIPEFHVKSDFSKLGMVDVANVISMVASKKATVTLKGDVKVGKWYYKKRFPVEFKKTINLSK